MAAPTRAQLGSAPGTWGLCSLAADEAYLGPFFIANLAGPGQSLSFLSIDTGYNGETGVYDLTAKYPIQIPSGAGDWTWSYWKGLYWAMGDITNETYKEFKVWKATDLGSGITTLDLWIATADGVILGSWPSGSIALFALTGKNIKQSDVTNPGDELDDVQNATHFRDNHYSEGTALMVDTWERVKAPTFESESFTGPFWMTLKIYDSASSGSIENEVINYSYNHW